MPKIDGAIDCDNKEKFSTFKWSKEVKYTCLMCKRKMDIFHSISDHGSRMICTLCAKQKYGGIQEALHRFCLNRENRN